MKALICKFSNTYLVVAGGLSMLPLALTSLIGCSNSLDPVEEPLDPVEITIVGSITSAVDGAGIASAIVEFTETGGGSCLFACGGNPSVSGSGYTDSKGDYKLTYTSYCTPGSPGTLGEIRVRKWKHLTRSVSGAECTENVQHINVRLSPVTD